MCILFWRQECTGCPLLWELASLMDSCQSGLYSTSCISISLEQMHSDTHCLHRIEVKDKRCFIQGRLCHRGAEHVQQIDVYLCHFEGCPCLKICEAFPSINQYVYKHSIMLYFSEIKLGFCTGLTPKKTKVISKE